MMCENCGKDCERRNDADAEFLGDLIEIAGIVLLSPFGFLLVFFLFL